MTRPRMMYPVYGYRNGMKEPVAVFFEYGEAASYCANTERNFYMDTPQYDRRPIVELEAKQLPDGSWRVAA